MTPASKIWGSRATPTPKATAIMAMYELRASRVQNIPAHGVMRDQSIQSMIITTSVFQAPITALAFNPDGKNLVTYSSEENKLSFWQTR